MHEFTSKKSTGFLLEVFLVSLILLALSGAWQLYRSAPESRTIFVTGSGKAVAKPDIAEVSFSVVSEGTVPASVQSLNDQKVSSVVEFVKSWGVDEEDVKTTSYNLSPQYVYDEDVKEPPKIIGYTLTQSLSVKVRDIAMAGEVVGGLTDAGANQIYGITFSVDDPEPLNTQAREEAVMKARVEAATIAKSLGVRLGKVLSMSESSNFVPAPFALGGAGGGIAFEKAPIEPGTLEFSVSVSITYSIR
ncbi:MAG: SIMPL domain-containing protein [Parcubacteria group bacterium]|nr:SIMPL domain-containing protein [Parcubacteria group bacterium]